jgi:hypothetical protein
VYHTAVWGRLVRDAGNYESCFLTAREGDQIRGLLPLLFVKSWLTGNRLVSLPFSDVCYPLADSPEVERSLLLKALSISKEKRAGYLEIRGLPAGRDDQYPFAGRAPADCQDPDHPDPESADYPAAKLPDSLGFAVEHHFLNYLVPLQEDADKVRMTFSRKSIRQTIGKSIKLGVTVRLGEGQQDVEELSHRPP